MNSKQVKGEGEKQKRPYSRTWLIDIKKWRRLKQKIE
jgi:hypothetical protein